VSQQRPGADAKEGTQKYKVGEVSQVEDVSREPADKGQLKEKDQKTYAKQSLDARLGKKIAHNVAHYSEFIVIPLGPIGQPTYSRLPYLESSQSNCAGIPLGLPIGITYGEGYVSQSALAANL
jgi:hypothetical protein